ncbi:hypothetical protein Sros01_83060 [Streptomyces roseochromogenus]|nr:hypothetical protein Sros01_83060 [Streptomyces roseochromogenus]
MLKPKRFAGLRTLAPSVTDEEGGGDRKDVTQLRPLLDDIPPVGARTSVAATTTSTATRFGPAASFHPSPVAAHPHGSGLGAYRC